MVPAGAGSVILWDVVGNPFCIQKEHAFCGQPGPTSYPGGKCAYFVFMCNYIMAFFLPFVHLKH